MSLLKFWRAEPEEFMSKTIEQILPMAGDGKLKDNSECVDELREFFTQIDRQTLKSYADQCLAHSFDGNGFVLQDIMNEVGRRFGLDVTHGLFRGRRNQNNADGLWRGEGWSFVIEVKTTDIYTLDLSKIADYQTAYTLTEPAQPSSCLIVVGRQDTATWEDQLRGSRYNREMRIVGVEALFQALELKEESEDPTLGTKLIDLLKPREFTRVDQIQSAALAFATDREQAVEASLEETDNILLFAQPPKPEQNSLTLVPEAEQSLRPYMSDRKQIEEMKAVIVNRIDQKRQTRLSGDRVCFRSQTDDSRFPILVSKAYDSKSKYWYGYRPRYIEYLAQSDNSFVVLGCLDSRRAFLLPVAVMDSLTPHMNTTPPDGSSPDTFYHIHVGQDGDRLFIYTHSGQQEHDITSYEI